MRKEIRLRPYEERLEALDLPSMFYRRRRGDMIQVYQILHGGMDITPEEFFILAASERTRGHPWKLKKPRAQARPQRQTLSVRVINDGNSLPPLSMRPPSTSLNLDWMPTGHTSGTWCLTSE